MNDCACEHPEFAHNLKGECCELIDDETFCRCGRG